MNAELGILKAVVVVTGGTVERGFCWFLASVITVAVAITVAITITIVIVIVLEGGLAPESCVF